MDIQSQIDKLQKQAADIKAKEFGKTVQDIRAKMQAFGITAKDLQTYKPKLKANAATNAKGKKNALAEKRANSATEKATKTPVAAKFRGPGGETWSGRGLTPRWLKTLTDQGRPKEEFAINP